MNSVVNTTEATNLLYIQKVKIYIYYILLYITIYYILYITIYIYIYSNTYAF